MVPMDSDLLEILVCPQSKNKLYLGDEKLFHDILQKIKAKELTRISGKLVTEEPNSVLYEPKTSVIYLVEENIPNLIYENGIKWNHTLKK